MKKMISFFFLGFFSDKASREGAKRGYTSVFVALLLAFVFIWAGFVGQDMLPFSAHYSSSPDFSLTVRTLLASPDSEDRIYIEVDGSRAIIKRADSEYTEGLLINTFENAADEEKYSVNGYNVVVDSRPADTLAEVVAYCVSNDGNNTEITYEEYLTLSSVARLNFDFRLRYTGNELVLTDELVLGYRAYIDSLGGELKGKAEGLSSELQEGKITKSEYNRAVYELYFENYYPDIAAYESTSAVPLLRNYYYREYIEGGNGKYLFVFDDYIAGAFETKSGIVRSFYGFYENVEDGVLIDEGVELSEAKEAADDFIKDSFRTSSSLTMYAHAMNVFSLIPFIALMLLVVTLLGYSILKLRGVKGITSFGGVFKIVGSYVWLSSVIAAVLAVIISFFVQPTALTLLPILLFFVTLAIRTVIFVIREIKSYIKQSEQETVQTEA